jgi:predicted nucleotide-binding protein
MKPRVFLGSSVEGLSVAYAIQTNLTHDADITVWSQGVFELSKTTIESLFDILNSVDFGIFVFTPDDLTKIREQSAKSVRDNVLFEFGLFLGKLGRQRVFFIVPSNQELHLPTDLLGVTPAIYESNRDDGNLIAATGVASHQVRQVLKKHGSLLQIEETSNQPEEIKKATSKEYDWLSDLIRTVIELSSLQYGKVCVSIA